LPAQRPDRRDAERQFLLHRGEGQDEGGLSFPRHFWFLFLNPFLVVKILLPRFVLLREIRVFAWS
jgi:hypothetical protein